MTARLGLLLVLAFTVCAAWGVDGIKFGVLAVHEKQQTRDEWQPISDALGKSLGRKVELLVYSMPELEDAIARNAIDLVLTDPSHYILLQHRGGLSAPLLTRITLDAGNELQGYGGVIFTRADAAGIDALADVPEHRIATMGRGSLGDYQMQAYELYQAGVPLESFAAEQDVQSSEEQVVAAVLGGRVPVGFVQTGVLERMAAAGALEMGQLRIINRQALPAFPCVSSTRLYPEWPIGVMPHVDEQLARQLVSVLMMLNAKGQPALHRFGIAANYSGVEEVMRSLRLPPYDTIPVITLRDLWGRHAAWIVVLGLMLSGWIVLGIRLLVQNRRIRRNENMLNTVLENVSASIYLKDAAGRYLYANSHALEQFGAGKAEAVGRGDEQFFDAKTSAAIKQLDLSVLVDGQTVRLEESAQLPGQSEPSTFMTVKLPLRDNNGSIYGLCGISTDISAIKEHERQLEQLAHFDTLTGLPNRVLLSDRLQHAMSQCKRRGSALAVAYVDLDGFKSVNDRYGHDAGDELLKTIALRMHDALREDDTLARIGGDEFVAVLADLSGDADCEQVLLRILAAAAQPVTCKGQLLQVSASIGVTLYPQDDADADQLMRHADHAMYLAKQSGKNRYHCFDVDEDSTVQSQHKRLEEMRGAMYRGEFELYYQPKVDMRSNRVLGAEALIRWRHPAQGMLEPAAFIPWLNGGALSLELDEWVMETALSQLEVWRAQGLDVSVSVNLAALPFQGADFSVKLSAALARHPRISPHHLELEILESSALQDLRHVSSVMQHCRNIGVRFALDDFGTGYSSLSYLKHLPADILKIDQSFVRDMLADEHDLAIVKGIIGLAQTFRREVVAEGVETAAHGQRLLSLGCHIAQGNGISRPMRGESFAAWTSDWQAGSWPAAGGAWGR